ncbi:MAG: ankyrin repeat domain-containing protein [Vicinamibacterales bacterium]
MVSTGAPAQGEIVRFPLVDAVRLGDSQAVTGLLARGVHPDEPTADGTTALHWAAELGHAEMVRMLLARGADPNRLNRYGASPLRSACLSGSPEAVEALLQAGATANAVRAESGDTPLMIAARAGHLAIVKTLLAHGATVDAVEPRRGQTALMWAAAEKHPAVVTVLLEAGADPKRLSKTKLSPLLFAIRAGDRESTAALLDRGLDVNAPAADGTRPLIFAMLNARFDLAKDLLERGADVKAEDPHGTPLQVLSFMRKAENIALATVLPRQLPLNGVDAKALARLLLAKGDGINARFKGRTVPRHIPVGSYRISFEGATPFFIAAITADTEWMKFLREQGADPSIPTLSGVTPLLAAAGIGFWEGETPGSNADAFEAVKLAAEYGNDPRQVITGGDKKDPMWEGATAMHGAATRGYEPMVAWLVERGVPIDKKTERGISAYHIATDNAGGMYHIAPEVAERLLALAKARGETVDTTPPAVVPRRY